MIVSASGQNMDIDCDKEDEAPMYDMRDAPAYKFYVENCQDDEPDFIPRSRQRNYNAYGLTQMQDTTHAATSFSGMFSQ